MATNFNDFQQEYFAFRAVAEMATPRASVNTVPVGDVPRSLLAENAWRTGFLIHNDTDGDILLAYDSIPSQTSFSHRLGPGGEIDFVDADLFSVPHEEIQVLFEGTTGRVAVTEWAIRRQGRMSRRQFLNKFGL
jgi:hypothetical protein